LLPRVRSFPERSLIFYSRQDYEDSNTSLSVFDVLVLVASSAKVPIFSTGGFVGYGSVGGYAYNTYQHGVESAKIAMRIMDGVQPKDIPIVEVPSAPIFDWRQLQHWGMKLSELPAGSQVRFRQPTLFERYKWEIIVGLTLCGLESILIMGLLAERRRRRRIQASLGDRLKLEILLSELST